MGGTQRKTIEAVIGDSQSLTDAIDLGGYRLAAIHMPSAWTAANLTLQAAPAPGGTYQDVHDDGGTEIAITAAASQVLAFTSDTAENLGAIRFVKIRSGTSDTPVAQDAPRTLTLVLK